jgi:hypothetical protein
VSQPLPQQTWLAADMRHLSLSRCYAGLLAWDSFFHLCPDDQRRVFSIFGRHAGPGAALMFTSGPSEGVAIGSYRGEPLYHASLSEAEYRSLLHQHGFEVVAHVAEDPECGGHRLAGAAEHGGIAVKGPAGAAPPRSAGRMLLTNRTAHCGICATVDRMTCLRS